MGADRRGPLAAFVLVAVIAAILLVTSVRSQAQPGWLDPSRIPATVVIAAPPAVDPEVWQTVTDELGMVVEEGALLARKATAEPTATTDPTESVVVATMPGSQVTPAVSPAVSPTHRAAHHHGRHTRVTAQARHGTMTGPDRGRTTAVSPRRLTTRASIDAVSAGHGHGHAYGRRAAHGHGAHAHAAHSHGAHSHGHAWGRSHH